MDVAVKRGTLLFVDDERRVLTSMRAMFRREYDVLLANSGQEAIDLLRDQRVDVIVSDQRMPGMTGVEVLKAVKHLAPNAMRILLTGYADLKAIEASINEGEVFRYLTKPCPSEELKEAIGLAAGIAFGDRPMQVANESLPTSIDAALPATTVVQPGVEHARPTHRELTPRQPPGPATLRPATRARDTAPASGDGAPPYAAASGYVDSANRVAADPAARHSQTLGCRHSRCGPVGVDPRQRDGCSTRCCARRQSSAA
ncbi:MAG: response regulator, partial [Proteobacteria bacterium]|nr:response regulator [Pseudomonadota bacterium]